MELVYAECFRRIDGLVRLVSPRRLLYLALDGVAPRAKLNQQRARRFCKARDSQSEKDGRGTRPGDWTCPKCSATVFARRAVCYRCKTERPADGSAAIKCAPVESAPEPEEFDSNCITPGTEFMADLAAALVFMIQRKMSEDQVWARLNVNFSGADVPGEGEHKILQYIRTVEERSHCIYSADADLIFLGLCAHEPNVYILREVPPNHMAKRNTIESVYKMEDVFGAGLQYYSIDVLREYLWLEFCSDYEPDMFDFERVVDDLVVICFLLGNDFLPASPTVEINEGTLDDMFELYKVFMIDGHITSAPGELRMQRLQEFMAELALNEEDVMRRRKKKLRGGRGGPGRRRSAAAPGPSVSQPVTMSASASRDESAGMNGEESGGAGSDSLFGDDTEECGGLFEDDGVVPEDKLGKRDYYMGKMSIRFGSAQMHDVCREYVRGMIWTLKYYCTGCCSWSWYYPYHYSPFLSDLTALTSYDFEFDLAEPYAPFQQLLAVLPPSSCSLLPAAYQSLMTNPTSPIIDFFPREFGTDLNGKRNDWEAIVLLQFVDEARLSAAIRSVGAGDLTPDEIRRNMVGTDLEMHVSCTEYVKKILESPLTRFPDMEDCRVQCAKMLAPTGSSTVKTGAYSTTFRHPTLELEFELVQPGNVRLFGDSPNKYASMILQIPDATGSQESHRVDAGRPNGGPSIPYSDLLGRHVRLFPTGIVGRVVGLVDDANEKVGDVMSGTFEGTLAKTLRDFETTKGVVLPACKSLLIVRPMVRSPDAFGEAVYDGSNPIAFPSHVAIQTTVAQHTAKSLSQGTCVTCTDIASPVYGLRGVVTTCNTRQETSSTSPAGGDVSVRFTSYPIGLDQSTANADCLQEATAGWETLQQLGQTCGCSAVVTRWILDSLVVKFKGNFTELGLGIHMRKQQLLRVGYAQRYMHYFNGCVVYAPRTAALVRNYRRKFPDLFVALEAQVAMLETSAATDSAPRFIAAKLLGATSAAVTLSRIEKYLSELTELQSAPLARPGQSLLSTFAISAAEKAMAAQQPKLSDHVVCLCKDQLQQALPGSLQATALVPRLGCWVAGALPYGPLPFGTLGIVVGIHTTHSTQILEVLTVYPATCGGSLGGRCSPSRGVM
eukprot:SAG31_NODE_3455_length_4251_cov_3.880058_2_plen_1118_part_01